MDQILPSPVDNIDVAETLASESRPAPEGRPWVLANMISSIDGAIAIDGVSGGLGGPADKEVFSALRALVDVIIVGSGTVVAEDYRRPQTSPAHQAARIERGQNPFPRLAIVSARLSIEPDHRVFAPEAPPMIITHGASPIDRRERLAEHSEVIIAGDTEVDLATALSELADRGTATVLLEGGPSLNGAMSANDLIDEMSVTVAPMLVGGSGGRMLAGNHTTQPLDMNLVRTLHQDGYLFHRYVRQAG